MDARGGGRRRPAFGRFGTALLLACLFMGARSTPASEGDGRGTRQAEIQISAVYGFGAAGYAKAGFWTPLRVLVTFQPSDPQSVIDGELVLLPGPFPQDTTYVTPLQMAGKGSKRIELYLIPSDLHIDADGYEFTLQIRSRGALLAEQICVANEAHALLDPRHRLVLNVGRTRVCPLPGGVPAASGKTAEQTSKLRTLCADMRPADLPQVAPAYDGVDAVVWYDPVPEDLDARQQEALAFFVRRGGHLVLAAAPDTRLGPQAWLDLPGSFVGSADLTCPSDGGRLVLPAAWRFLARADGKGVELPRLPASGRDGSFWISRLEIRQGQILAADRGHALLLRAGCGLGRITMLAADLNGMPFAGAASWTVEVAARVLDLPLRPEHMEILGSLRAPPVVSNPWHGHGCTASSPAEVAADFLAGASELQPIAFGWILLFCVAFFLVAGPFNFMLLRSLDRLTWTWAAFGATSVLFALLAWGGAYLLKGSSDFTRVVAVEDQVGPDRVWRTRYTGIFSTRPRQVVLECGRGAFVRDMGTLAMGRRQFGVRNDAPAASSGSGTQVLLQGTLAPAYINLRQWKMERFVFSVPERSQSGLSARFARSPEGEGLVGWISNTGSRVLEGVQVVTDQHVYLLGDLAPGETMRLRKDLMSSIRSEFLCNRLSACFSQAAYWEWQPRQVLTAENALALSFPVLAKALYAAGASTGQHGQVEIASLPGGVDLLIRHLLARDTDALPAGTPLSRWQILETLAEAEDEQRRDLTRVLCGGGGVILGLDRGPASRVSLTGRSPAHTGWTVVRRVLPPESLQGDPDSSDLSSSPRSDSE